MEVFPVKIADTVNVVCFLFSENILKYFRVFEVYVPKEKMKASFAGPSFPHVEIKQRRPQTLPPGKNTNEKI